MALMTNRPYDGPIGGGGGGGGGGSYGGGGGLNAQLGITPGSYLSGFNFRRSKIKLPDFPAQAPPTTTPNVPRGFSRENAMMQNSVPGGGAFYGDQYYPYFGIEGRSDFGIPGTQLGLPADAQGFSPGAAAIPGLDQKYYNAALQQGYPTRERVSEIMARAAQMRGASFAPRMNLPSGMGEQIGGSRPESYLAAKDRMFGGMM